MEKTDSSNPSEILNQEFFDTIKNSKKINIKTQKIKELSKYFSSTEANIIQSTEIKNKIPDLYDLLLINLNENNNNYVLAQMELIQVLGQKLYQEENYKVFIKQSLPKLFDKFYLGNSKINEILIKMFSEFIEYKILSIKDYYQYIENIPLDEEDNYRINILNFLYDNINKDETVLLNNIPKSINELIKKLINDNESDISETASKILNILINRDIESNKKKEVINTEQVNDKKSQEDKGGTPMSAFVNNIVSAIKQNVDSNNNSNKDNNNTNIDNNIDGNNENKDNNVNQGLITENKNNENDNVNNNKDNNDKEINSIENKDNITKKEEDNNLNEKKDDNNNIIINKEEKNNDNKFEENKKEEIIVDNKKEETKDEINNEEQEKSPEIKDVIKAGKTNEEKDDEKKEEKNIEEKKEEKIDENIKKETNVEETKTNTEENKSEIKQISEEKKDESNLEIKKEENIIDKKEEIPTNENKENTEDKNNDIKEDKKPDETKEEEKKEDLNKKSEENKEIKEIKEITNKEDKKEEKIDEQKDQIKNEISNKEEKIQEEKPKETTEIKEEKKEDNNIQITPEIKPEDNTIKIQENKNDNIISNGDKKEETPEKINIENKDTINKENNIEEKKEINNQEIKEETKEKINPVNTEENKPTKEKKEEEQKKELIEQKPKEEIKPEIKEENKEIQISDKKEEIKQPTDKNENEVKKENTQEKKEEKKDVNKNDKKKPSGIKSKISKFRKNFGKNKNKDGGFEFELVMDKKKENPPQEKEETKEEKTNIEEKKDEQKNKEVEPKKNEEIKKDEEKPKEIKEEKKEESKLKEESKPKDEIKPKEESKPKEEIKPKESELKPIKEEKPKEKEKIEEKKPEEKPKEETKEESKPIPESTKELNPIKEEKIEEEIKTPVKPKEEEPKKDIPKETADNNTNKDNNTEEKPEVKSLGINQESLNEFEKKLQLALEQEAKDKNNNENLVDTNPAPIKQKKEDPKFDEIKSVLGKEIVESLFSPKWETKKHGFELINEFINTKPKQSYNINDLIEYMKLKLKNYKETNFNINREAINIYINMIKKKIISKDILINIIIAYHEKLSDIKLKDNIIDLINNSFDIIEPSNILKQIITKISKKNNAKLLIEYATFFGNVIEEYDVRDLPNKDIIDFCKILANNSNPQVRTSAISLLCILYKYLGKDVKTLTRDIKESTLKLIDAELDKVKVIDPKESTNKKKKAASVIENSDNKSGNNNNKNKDLIPPQDISKKITPQIIKLLNSAKWAEKKEGCENIEKILTSANMRILPNGLNTLMTTIKKKLSDSNKNFVKMLVSLLSKLIEAMKQGFKQWAKPIALELIPNLADKNQLMRNECQNCFDKWVEFAGFDSLVIHFPKFLTTDNVEMRIEILNFFMKYKDKFNKSTGENVYKDMMNPLLICLQDRSSNVRNLTEEIIKISLTYNPITNYYKKIEDFKPAIAKTLNQILDKIKKETSSNESKQENNNNNNTNNTESENQSQLHLNTEPNKTNEKLLKVNNNINSNNKTSNKKLTIQTSETSLKSDDSDKNESSTTEDALSNYNTINTISNFSNKIKKIEKDSNNKTNKKTSSNVYSKKTKPKRKLSEDDLVNPLGTAMNKQMPATSVDHLASNSTILRKKEFKSFQKHPSQVVKPNNAVFLINVKVIPNKTKRYDKDKKTKFNLETANKDYFIKLKEQCKSLFTEIFSKKIFSDDFRKQVEAFKDMKSQIDKKINIPIYFDNLDLILKIIGIKILNSLNPTLMKNFFEFLDSLYQVVFENKYKLNDTESNIIISLLIDKLSLNNNTLKEHLLSLLNKYIEYMDTNKIMSTVINVALNKNNKIKTDILDLTIDLVSQEKLNISNKIYAKLFCRFLPIYDNIIKNKTLSLFQEIYSNIGEELWSMIEISEKDKEFLEENLCADDDGEDEEREGEEEEEDEEGVGDGGTNQISNEVEKNEINSNTSEKNISNIEENKKGNKDIEKKKILGGKNGPLTKDDLDIILDNLLIDDQNEKLNTIIIIHENICGKYEQNKEILIPNIDKIISTFKVVSHKLFYMKDLNSIPIKFAKYLAIVFCKLASNKELISHLSYNILLDICRELMRYLLIKDLDRIGEQQEGNIIFKSINSTMLRILENCDTTFVISAFLELIKEFLDKDDKNMVNLAIKCLLKSTHNLEQNINSVNISKILLQIHLLLLSLQKNNKDLKKSQTNVLIMNTVKNIVSDFVKLKKEKILEEYSKSVKNHQFNDKYLLKWIKAALEKP